MLVIENFESLIFICSTSIVAMKSFNQASCLNFPCLNFQNKSFLLSLISLNLYSVEPEFKILFISLCSF